MYHAIGFDWGGVMSGPAGDTFDKQMSDLLETSLEEYSDTYNRHRHDFDDGRIDTVTLWNRVAKELGKTEKIDAMLELQSSRDGVVLNQGIVDLVQTISKKGLKLGLLSNNTVENGRKIRQLPIMSIFDVIQISGEVNVSKPDVRAYELFCKSMALEPAEIIFIDDDEQNSAVARSCGMTAVKFDDISQCANDLRLLEIV